VTCERVSVVSPGPFPRAAREVYDNGYCVTS
jgi:hypothetical protein